MKDIGLIIIGLAGLITTQIFVALSTPGLKDSNPNPALSGPTLEQPKMSEKVISPEEKEVEAQKKKERDAQMCLTGSRNAALCERYKAQYDCQITCRGSGSSSLVADEETPTSKQATELSDSAPTTPANSPTSGTTRKQATPSATARTPARTTRRLNPASESEAEEGTQDNDEPDSSTPKISKAKTTVDTGDTSDMPDKTDTKKAQDDKPTQDQDQQQQQRKQADNNSDSSSGSSDTGESDALDRCNSLYSSAVSACNVTDETKSASESEGVTDACQQSTSKGVKSSKSKTNAANACTSAFSKCEIVCDDYARKYSDGDYTSSFSSKSNSCGALSYKVDEMLSASHSGLDLAQSGLDCTKSASESPQTASGDEKAQKAKAAAQAASTICAAEPGSPNCVQAAQTAAALEASGGLGDAAQSRGTALIPDEPGENAFSGLFQNTGAPAAAAKTATIPNNSGGSILGGGFQSSSTASDRRGSIATVGGALTDIEQGFLGGGYSQALKGENPYADGPISDADLRFAIAALGGTPPPKDEKIDIDLRRYLPGGDLYRKPNRDPAAVSELHGKWTDIFEKLHDRYEVICKLRKLVGCENGMPTGL